MRFHILGPVQAFDQEGHRLPLRPRETTVLATLLTAPNLVVPVSRLVDAVWGDDAPPTARRQIQTSVWILRQTFPVTTDGPGYRLRVEPDELDSLAFQDLVRQAREQEAAGLAFDAVLSYRAALEHWRGPALAGCVTLALESVAAGLDELRLVVWESCVDLELALGRHHQLTAELTELVGAHPLRERLAGQLMTALHRCGRPVDALEVYRRLRAAMVEDLGIEPGPQLAALQTAILRQDESADGSRLDGPPAGGPLDGRPLIVPRQLPAPVRHFVGRTDHVKDVRRWIAEEPGDRCRATVLAVSGMAGVGKTALAVYWAHELSDQFPDGQLYVNLRGYGPGGPPMRPADAIRGFLDAFAVPPHRIPRDDDAQAALYRSLVADRRVLVVLDNASDARQVRPLLPGATTCLVLVTSRRSLAGLTVSDGAEPVVLDLFDGHDARDLLARHLGPDRVAAEPAAAEEIIVHCAGLPLALAIVAARAAERPTFPLATFADELRDAERRLEFLDSGDDLARVAASFTWSYERLGATAARLFRLLSLHPGPDISPLAAASLLGAARSEARSALAELAGARLVAEQRPGRYSLHDLIRAYAADQARTDPEAERGAATRRMLDHYLHTASRAEYLIQPQAYWPTAPGAPEPGTAPEEVATFAASMAWFAAEYPVLLAAIDAAARDGYDTHVWQLALVLTDFLERTGRWATFVRTQLTALDATIRLADARTEANTRRVLARAYRSLRRSEEGHAHLERARELAQGTGDEILQAYVHTGLALNWSGRGDPGLALHHAEEALARYDRAKHQWGQASSWNNIGWYRALIGDYLGAVAAGEAALVVALELDDDQVAAVTWDTLGYAYHRLGDQTQALACYRHALDRLVDRGNYFYEAAILEHVGDAHHDAGQPDHARTAWRRADAILRGIDHPDAGRVRGKLDASDHPRHPRPER